MDLHQVSFGNSPQLQVLTQVIFIPRNECAKNLRLEHQPGFPISNGQRYRRSVVIVLGELTGRWVAERTHSTNFLSPQKAAERKTHTPTCSESRPCLESAKQRKNNRHESVDLS